MDTFKTEFKKLAHEKKLTRYDMALYCLSKAILKDNSYERASIFLNKSFTPVTKSIKLKNGARPWFSLWDALHSLDKALLTIRKQSELFNYNFSGPWAENIKLLTSTMTEDDLVKISSLLIQFKSTYGEIRFYEKVEVVS